MDSDNSSDVVYILVPIVGAFLILFSMCCYGGELPRDTESDTDWDSPELVLNLDSESETEETPSSSTVDMVDETTDNARLQLVAGAEGPSATAWGGGGDFNGGLLPVGLAGGMTACASSISSNGGRSSKTGRTRSSSCSFLTDPGMDVIVHMDKTCDFTTIAFHKH